MKLIEKLKFLISYWWVMALAVLGISVFVLGHAEGGTSERENRTLQGKPVLTLQSLIDGTFQEQFEDYLSDQLPVRNDVLDISASVMGIFDVRSDEDMILSSNMAEELDDSVGDAEAEQELSAVTAGGETAEAEQAADGTAAEAADEPDGNAAEPAAEPETNEAGAETADETAGGETDEEEFEAAEGGEVPDNTDADVADLSVVRYFYFTRTDGKTSRIASFGESAMTSVVNALNAYKDVLPEDGRVYFTWIPFSQTANEWLFNTKTYNGWYSEVDATLQANVEDGVYIYSSVNELCAHMQAGEQVFYKTDHHWSGLGAYYMIQKMVSDRGEPSVAYYDFEYTTYDDFRGSISSETASMYNRKVVDKLEVPGALAPATAAEYHNLHELIKTVRYMEPWRNSYGAFLGGTHGPFFVVETGFHTGRKALVISDSFGNAFFPYLAPYYDTVCQLDLRETYSFIKSGGGSVSEYLKEWGIDDVYFVVSQGKGVNSRFMRINALKYLY